MSGMTPEEEKARRDFTEKLGAALNSKQKENLLKFLGLIAESNKDHDKEKLNQTKLPKLPDSEGGC